MDPLLLTAGITPARAGISALLTILTNHAMMMHPENPAQWMRENGLKFQKGGSTKGLAQSAFDVSKRGVTKLSQFGEKLSEVQARGEQPSSIKWIDPKTGYFFSGEQIQHSINTHKLTPKDLDDAYSGLGKYYDVWTSKVEEGRFHGQPIFARIKGNGRDFYVSLEITPNGEVHVLTIAPTNDGLYNDYKKTHGSKSLTPEGAESDGNHVLVMDSIYDALGIVKYNQLGKVVESQKAEVRTKYEGTDQWMLAPNGKTTNLTEDQWLAVRTPACKEWGSPPLARGLVEVRVEGIDSAGITPARAGISPHPHSYGAIVVYGGESFSVENQQEKEIEKFINSTAIPVESKVFVGDEKQKAHIKAVNWFKKEFGISKTIPTIIGDIVIHYQGIKSSLAHKYSQKKLDCVYSVVKGMKQASYIKSIPDYDDKRITNHFFVYKVIYEGEENFVLCRIREQNNVKKFYIHEVGTAEEIKLKSDTLQTRADGHNNHEAPRGIALYTSILSEFSNKIKEQKFVKKIK